MVSKALSNSDNSIFAQQMAMSEYLADQQYDYEAESYWQAFNIQEDEHPTAFASEDTQVEPSNGAAGASEASDGAAGASEAIAKEDKEAAIQAMYGFLGIEEPSEPGMSDEDIVALMAKIDSLAHGPTRPAKVITEIASLATPVVGGAVSHQELYARIRTDYNAGLSDTNLPIIQRYLQELKERIE